MRARNSILFVQYNSLLKKSGMVRKSKYEEANLRKEKSRFQSPCTKRVLLSTKIASKEMILPYNRNMVNPCLLFVEADIDIGNMVKIYFSLYWDVYLAASGSDALKIASQVSPQLIILDLNLPDMDGLEVFRALRTNTRTAHIPVIFLANKKEAKGEDDLPRVAIQELASKADDYIVNPVDLEELKLRVQGALKRSERESLIDPRSRLPTGRLIKDQLRRIAQPSDRRLLEVYINNFEPFRDAYGIEAGDDVLRFTAMLLGEVIDELGTTSDFIGHAGEDNFIIVTKEEKVDAIKARLKERFNREILAYYDDDSTDGPGSMYFPNADGTTGKIPLMAMSIKVVPPSL